eukprot:CAMPEP_0118955676 /NCGR_PEP_ID=MMETSP1169-20130426/60340_1 /TAXON_ID=36882 /ORGANISM="Pyramimonas obovata, Strain CCMP722" /LENGTH=255 /DNA_ID=CAMNT_0006903565 /DNA_START=234 /DNA_END=998 /DNA_ORIENTATION=+
MCGQYEEDIPNDNELALDGDYASTPPESTAGACEEEDAMCEVREQEASGVNGETPVEAAARQLSALLGLSDDGENQEEQEEEPKVEEAKGPADVYVMPPVVAGLEQTVAFGVDKEQIEKHSLKVIKRPRMYLKITGICSNAVKQAFKKAGFRTTRGNNWNAMWANALKPEEYSGIANRYQKINHFPGTWELGRKDKLYRNIARMRRTHGAEFDIVPRHFVLPRDADEWKSEYERHPSNVYIMKPCSSSRGRGIRV